VAPASGCGACWPWGCCRSRCRRSRPEVSPGCRGCQTQSSFMRFNGPGSRGCQSRQPLLPVPMRAAQQRERLAGTSGCAGAVRTSRSRGRGRGRFFRRACGQPRWLRPRAILRAIVLSRLHVLGMVSRGALCFCKSTRILCLCPPERQCMHTSTCVVCVCVCARARSRVRAYVCLRHCRRRRAASTNSAPGQAWRTRVEAHAHGSGKVWGFRV
jgi:hypothetical protein